MIVITLFVIPSSLTLTACIHFQSTIQETIPNLVGEMELTFPFNPLTGINDGCADNHGHLGDDCRDHRRFTFADYQLRSFSQRFENGYVFDEIEDIHTDISSMTTMADLLFGTETSIGQVCAYARALEDGDVTDLPGYCCLDVPVDTIYWGEQVRST